MRLILSLSLIALMGCASRPCHEPQSPQEKKAEQARLAAEASGEKPAEAPTAVKTPESAKTTAGHIFVAKGNGAKQCETQKGTALDVMEKQLKGIKVYSRSTKSDGLMRTQVCGASTGQFNVYEIDSTNLEKAKKLGFTEWNL